MKLDLGCIPIYSWFSISIDGFDSSNLRVRYLHMRRDLRVKPLLLQLYIQIRVKLAWENWYLLLCKVMIPKRGKGESVLELIPCYISICWENRFYYHYIYHIK